MVRDPFKLMMLRFKDEYFVNCYSIKIVYGSSSIHGFVKLLSSTSMAWYSLDTSVWGQTRNDVTLDSVYTFSFAIGDSLIKYTNTYELDSNGRIVYKRERTVTVIERDRTSVPQDRVLPPPPGVGAYTEFGTPYNSIGHLTPRLVAIIACGFLLFILYVGFRVWRSLKREKERE